MSHGAPGTSPRMAGDREPQAPPSPLPACGERSACRRASEGRPGEGGFQLALSEEGHPLRGLRSLSTLSPQAGREKRKRPHDFFAYLSCICLRNAEAWIPHFFSSSISLPVRCHSSSDSALNLPHAPSRSSSLTARPHGSSRMVGSVISKPAHFGSARRSAKAVSS